MAVLKTTPRDVRLLRAPHPKSHKWQNGSVLVIGGSERYHGAPLLTLTTAAKFVDIVHFASPGTYKSLLPKLRGKLFEFIPVFDLELPRYIDHVDVVIAGPGFAVTQQNKKLLNHLVSAFPTKRWVFDAGAIRMINFRLLSQRHILTPNAKEFRDMFAISSSRRALINWTRSHRATVLLKGPVSKIVSSTHYTENHTGNAGLTKGGSGDVLAGLIGAFFTKNPAFLSAKAASYLLGKTADTLAQKRSFAYSATDLMNAIPEVFGNIRNAKKDSKLSC